MYPNRNGARIAICVAAFSCPAVLRGGETAAESAETYNLAGIAADSITGAPVARALVRIWCFGAGGAVADDLLTNGGGGFRFTGLPQGRCTVSAKRPGFEDGQPEDAGGLVVGPSRENLRIAMKPVTVITGRVADRGGDPVEGVLVQALRFQIVQGRSESGVYAWATTDDKGRYRLANLWKGPFYVRAVGNGGSTRFTAGAVLPEAGAGESFAPVYYAGSSDMASATVIPPSPGEESHADLTITLEPGYRIRGVIGGFAPNRAAEIELLRGKDDFATGRVLLNVATAQFEIHDVTAGSYLLRITQGNGNQRTRAILPVNITGDVTGLKPELTPGADVIFQLHGDSDGGDSVGADVGGEDDSLDQSASRRHRIAARPLAMVQLHPEDDRKNDILYSQPDEQGTVRVKDVLPGRYSIWITPFRGYVSSIVCGTRDLTDNEELDVSAGVVPEPVEVTIRSDGGSVNGDVTTGGKPASGASVLLVSASAASRVIGPATSDGQGKFSIAQVPPGTYTAWAWHADAEVEYRNPLALQALGMQPVSVAVTAKAEQSVEVVLPEEHR
jgi:hypothetical protein